MQTSEEWRASMARLWMRCLLLCCLVLLLSGCPEEGGGKGTVLEQNQRDYSAAIRWGDFEGAWNLVDPKVREEHPLTDIDFSRYKQVQISGYRELGSSVLGNGDVLREIEIGVVNKYTMVERTVRYREQWHYDEAHKTWWQMSSLPDLWQQD